MAIGNPSLVCGNISKRFGDTLALNEVSFKISRSQYLCIIGPSGAGKTTLLRIIAGLEKPTNGEVSLDGRDLGTISTEKRNVAMLFQDYALFPHLSVYDNIAVGSRIRHLPKSEIKEKVENVASLLGIERFVNRKPRQLSGGEQQRVALARAIVREPDLFLLDEPLANLDAELRATMKSELRELQKKVQKTFIHVTHDQSEALSISDVVLLLDKGECIDFGLAEEVYSNPSNMRSAQFIGFPRINKMNATITSMGSSVEFAICGFSSMLLVAPIDMKQIVDIPNRDITLGIRPESLSLSSSLVHTLLGRGRITDREFFGMVVYTIEVGEYQLRMIDSQSRFYDMGDIVDVYVDLGKASFFDRVTGKNLFLRRNNAY